MHQVLSEEVLNQVPLSQPAGQVVSKQDKSNMQGWGPVRMNKSDSQLRTAALCIGQDNPT